MEEGAGKVPGNALKLGSLLRISGLGSNMDGRDPDFRRMEGGEWVNLPACLCLTFTSVHAWMDGQKDGPMRVG